MVRIPGKLGKTSGSPEGLGEFEQEFYLTNDETASLLRDLAQEIEAKGKVEAAFGSWAVAVNPVPPHQARGTIQEKKK
jgi:amphi-Trp domain-containing protein